MSAPQQPPHNRLGAVTFVIAVLGAVLAVIPATVAFGGLLCVIAIIPAIVSFRRVRKGTANNRRQSVAALVLAPVFFIVAVSLSPSPPANTTADDRTPLSNPVSTPALPVSTPALQQSSPAITPLPALAPAPELAPARVVAPAPHLSPAPALAPAHAPARAAAPVPAPAAAPASPAAPPNAGSPTRSTESPSTGSTGGSPYYANCAAARAAGAAPLHKGDPGYRSGLDRDGDGTACE
jgi:Excalibur calcium-binding domain